MEFVINTSSKLLLRFGFSTFSVDAGETLLTAYPALRPCRCKANYWNVAIEDFQDAAP